MVDDNKWLNVIQDAKLLDQQAENEDYVPIMTDALKNIWSLIDKLGNYSISIGGYSIKFLPEYQEIKDILKEILK